MTPPPDPPRPAPRRPVAATQCEIALLRLKAFELLNGYDPHSRAGAPTTFNLEGRKDAALALAEWALKDSDR